jgi:polysaccharide pyruvyl transferase CsaB
VRLAISGYYGFGNAGDEAVLGGILAAFKLKAGTEPNDAWVLSGDPAATEREHGVHAVPRMDGKLIRQAFRDADLIISGGGSLLQDVTSLRSLAYYLWTLALARRSGRPVFVYAQGIGPLRRAISRWVVRWFLARVDAITVRDEASAETLRRIGLRRAEVRVTADPVFALPAPDRARGRAALRAAGIDDGRPVVGIAPRPWPGTDVVGLAARTARKLADGGYAVALMPMQVQQDAPICREAAAACGEGGRYVEAASGYRAAMELCAGVDAMIGMRMHALAFGAVGGAALVGIAYDPKVSALMHTLWQAEYGVPVEQAQPERLVEAVVNVLQEQSGAVDRRCRAVEALRESALANADYAMQIAARAGSRSHERA